MMRAKVSGEPLPEGTSGSPDPDGDD
jgi:hypothetical protein